MATKKLKTSSVVNGRKIEKRSRVHIAREVVDDFCSNTTVHGIRYFTERKRHWFERVWWAVAFIASVYLCSEYIRIVWSKWQESPVIVRFDNQALTTKAVPFPAVTICPMTKIQSDHFNFTKTWLKMSQTAFDFSNISTEELENIKVAHQICDDETTNIRNLSFNGFHDDFTDSSIYKMIQNLAPDVDAMLTQCKWLNRPCGCQHHFKPIFTEEGICYTFNSLNSAEIYRDNVAPALMTVVNNTRVRFWSLENGYGDVSDANKAEVYPHRVFGTGLRAGLSVLLSSSEMAFDFACSGPDKSFKIALHTPDEIPQISRNFFHIPNERHAILTVKPNVVTTIPILRDYPLGQRQCYFSEERHLQFFRTYNQRNCEFECFTNFTLVKCDCVAFPMPRTNKTNVCGTTKVNCYYQAEDDFFNKSILETCRCLPNCNLITYDVTVSQAKADYDHWLKATRRDLNGSKPTGRLSITFKDLQFIPSKRQELYNKTDFLANCGGLLGLFTGISLLSLFEMFYFFTIRLGCSLRDRKVKKARNIVAPAETEPISCICPANGFHLKTQLN